MKAFIIHTHHDISHEYAKKCMNSIKQYNGWEPEYFSGITVETLNSFEKDNPLKIKEKSRASGFFQQKSPLYPTKKCCSMNHYRLFKICIKLNEPIAVIEHDSHCIRDWDSVEFDEILTMNAISALTQPALKSIRKYNNKIPNGITDINIEGLVYRHDPAINGAFLIPGTAAYAITPKGAKKMIEVYENIGWEQSDFIINTAYVRIQVISPEYFTFKLPNLQMSHGIIK